MTATEYRAIFAKRYPEATQADLDAMVEAAAADPAAAWVVEATKALATPLPNAGPVYLETAAAPEDQPEPALADAVRGAADVLSAVIAWLADSKDILQAGRRAICLCILARPGSLGESKAAVARRFNVPKQCLNTWLNQAKGQLLAEGSAA